MFKKLSLIFIRNKKLLFIIFLFLIFYFFSPTNYKSITTDPIDPTHVDSNDVIIYYFDKTLSFDQKLENEYITVFQDINNSKIKFNFIEDDEKARIITTYRGLFINFYEFNDENYHRFKKNIYSINIYCSSEQLKFINL